MHNNFIVTFKYINLFIFNFYIQITFIAILIVAVSSAPTADDDKNANVVKNDFVG